MDWYIILVLVLLAALIGAGITFVWICIAIGKALSR